MKKLIILLFSCSMAAPLLGQEGVVTAGYGTFNIYKYSGNPDGWGVVTAGYGAFNMKFTPIKNEWSLIVGGCGGWVINYYDIHSFVIGGGGYGLVKSPKVTYQGEDQSLSMNYGGLFLEYVMLPKNMIHPSIGGLLGLGSVRFGDVKDTTGIYVIDPAINVMLNVTEFFQAGFQVGYRVVAGVDLPGFSNSDLSNVTVGLLLKFGKFY